MPSVSQAQSRAMHAAAEGHSTLGIPRKVGKDFVKADEGKKVGKLPEKKGKKREKDRRSLGERIYGKQKFEQGPNEGRDDNG